MTVLRGDILVEDLSGVTDANQDALPVPIPGNIGILRVAISHKVTLNKEDFLSLRVKH